MYICLYIEHKETIFMRNINFNSFLINFIIAFVIAFFATTLSSCQEESPTRAIRSATNFFDILKDNGKK